MILYNEQKQKTKIIKTKKPKFSDKFGRTWDVDNDCLFIDGSSINIHLDTSFGIYGYFLFKDIWYKIKLFKEINENNVLDIPIFEGKIFLYTFIK